MKVELDLSLDELGRIVSLLKKWRKAAVPVHMGVLWKMTDEEQKLADRSDKVGAIRMVRARTGLGLKEAKDLVEGVVPS